MKPVQMKSVAVSDNRGVFSASSLTNHKGEGMWIQTNVSYNLKKHTFRGMHLQRYPDSQTKLVKVVSGSIIDVVVNLDKDSEDYMKEQWFTLEQGDELLVPKGFAHGFITLVDHTVVQYLVDHPYTPEADVSIHWSSFKKIKEIFDVEYPDMIISDKDTNAPQLYKVKL